MPFICLFLYPFKYPLIFVFWIQHFIVYIHSVIWEWWWLPKYLHYTFLSSLSQSVAHCYKPLQMEVIVTDSENRKFDNISSLTLKWSVSNEELASIPAEPSSPSQVTTVQGFTLPMKSRITYNLSLYPYLASQWQCDNLQSVSSLTLKYFYSDSHM